MIKYGDSSEKVYGSVMNVIDEIAKETKERLEISACKEEKVNCKYKIGACRFLKEYIKDNSNWCFSYNSVFKMLNKDKLEECLNTLAAKLRKDKWFKLGNTKYFKQKYMIMMDESMKPMQVNKETDFLCRIRDTHLIAVWYGMRDIKEALKRVETEIGCKVLTISPRENINDAKATYNGLMYVLDTAENREILAKYYTR